jgi:hypothetical protein
VVCSSLALTSFNLQRYDSTTVTVAHSTPSLDYAVPTFGCCSFDFLSLFNWSRA